MSFICSISLQPCKEPVVTKDGNIYERELIEKMISSTGVDPITKQPLNSNDLIVLKAISDVSFCKPFQVGECNIPSMIDAFRNEWNVLMLELFNVREKLADAQKELSHSLYERDAACRVIARLIRERDYYKNQLSEVKLSVLENNQRLDSNAMDVDVVSLPGLSGEMIDEINSLKERLSSERQDRKIDPNTISRDQLCRFDVIKSKSYNNKTGTKILCLDFHRSNLDLIAAGASDGSIILYDRSADSIITTLSNHLHAITNIRFSEQYKLLSSDNSGILLVWMFDVENNQWKQKYSMKIHTSSITCLDVHPIGKLVLTGSKDRTLALYDIENGIVLKQIKDLKYLDLPVLVAKFHPDGEIMASAGEDATIHIWKVESQEHMTSFSEHTGKITDLAWHENGWLLASASSDQTIRLWDLVQVELYKTIELDTAPSKIIYDQSGRYLAALCNNEIRIFLGKNLSHIATLDRHSKDVSDFKWSPLANWAASSSFDGTIKFWSVL